MFIIDFLQFLFAGTRGLIISGASAALISGYIVARVTFGFQKRLLKLQLEANRQLHQEMLEAQQKGQAEFQTLFAKQLGQLTQTIRGYPPV